MLFLVNPSVRIPSTSHIPAQDSAWILQGTDISHPTSPFGRLPVELRDLIIEMTGCMLPGEARYHRDQMVEERANFERTQNEMYFEVQF